MSKSIVEDCYIVSVSDLMSRGLLPTNDSEPVLKSVRFDWDKNGQRVQLVGIRVDTSAGEAGIVYLDCVYPPSGIEQTQEIRLATTTPNYGGVRYWFVCPCYRGGMQGSYCNRKVRKLYLPDSYEFGCRHCHRLSYADRNVSRPDRDGLVLMRGVCRIMQSAYGKDWRDKMLKDEL